MIEGYISEILMILQKMKKEENGCKFFRFDSEVDDKEKFIIFYHEYKKKIFLNKLNGI